MSEADSVAFAKLVPPRPLDKIAAAVQKADSWATNSANKDLYTAHLARGHAAVKKAWNDDPVIMANLLASYQWYWQRCYPKQKNHKLWTHPEVYTFVAE